MKKTGRIIAFILSIILAIPGVIIPSHAKDVIQDSEIATDNIIGDDSTEFNIPDIIDKEEIIEHGYIGRVTSEENDLYTFVFHNIDGSNTMRIYDHPVKYIDKSGETRDISLDIKETADGNYTSAEHEITTTFHKKLTDGITLAYNDILVTMIPTVKALGGLPVQISPSVSDMKSVSYAIDDKTSYEYSLTYTGFKEDIVVSEYTGQSEYDFTLYTNGLALEEMYGSYYLVDEDGNVQATIGDIIVFTADERNNTFGSMTHETVITNQEYRMTIHLDASYLRDFNTTYPIRIDPTIEINYDKNGAGAIEDVTINSLSGSNGSSGSLSVGLRSTYGISRILMRFPGLSISSLPSADKITSASVEIRDLMCEAEALSVYCYPFTGNSWTENTATWANVSPNSYGSLLSSTSISYSNGAKLSSPHRYSFNILSAVKGWKNGTYSHAKGIIFKASSSVENGSTNICKTIASYNRSGNKPSLSITYETIILESGVYALSKQNTSSYARCNTVNGGTYMSQETFSSPPASASVRRSMFKIIYRASTNDYIIRDMVNNEVIIYANVSNNAPMSLKMAGIGDSGIPSDKAWKITKTSDGYYNISCTKDSTTYYMYMPSSGNLALTTNKDLSGAKWNLHHYTGSTFRGWGKIGDWPEHIENGSSATIEAYIYSTVLNENSAYLICNSDKDIAVGARSNYSARMTITPKYGGNTKIRIEATTGNAVFGYYYLVSGWDDGCFFIQNQYSSECLTTLGGDTEAELRLTSMPNGANNKYAVWRMKYWGNGYYWIVQDNTGESIYDNSGSNTYNIRTKPWTDSAWKQNLWKFIPQTDGSFKIQNYYNIDNSTNKCLSLDSSTTKNVRSLSVTGDKQLWIVKPMILHISVIFDQGFVDRYGSAYKDYLKAVYGNNSKGLSFSNVFKERFGIRLDVVFSNTVNKSYPYVNNCNYKDEFDTYCNNCNNPTSKNTVNDCENGLHHKAELKFLEQVPNGQLLENGKQTNILYTGHRGCYTDGSSHSFQHAYGWSYISGNQIVVMAALFDSNLLSGNIDNILRTTVHEHLHSFGAPHCDKSEDCIMSKNEPSINVNLKMCSVCKKIVNENKYKLYKMSIGS